MWPEKFKSPQLFAPCVKSVNACFQDVGRACSSAAPMQCLLGPGMEVARKKSGRRVQSTKSTRRERVSMWAM